MSLGTNRDPRSAEDLDGQTASPDAGSVWWTDLLLGAVCLLAAAVFALAHTSIGPFADYTVVYAGPLAAAYVVVALGLGLTFVRKGVRHRDATAR